MYSYVSLHVTDSVDQSLNFCSDKGLALVISAHIPYGVLIMMIHLQGFGQLLRKINLAPCTHALN